MPRHHTVPEVYLKGFLDPKKVATGQNVLWLYMQDRKIRPRGVDAVGSVEGFNRDPEIPGHEEDAEMAYMVLEDAARPVLEKLRSGEPKLTEQEKASFSHFIAFQKFRTTWYRETVNRASVDGVRHACRRMLDERRVHEVVATTEAERSRRVEFTLPDAKKFISELADGTIELTQSSVNWALGGALEGGQKLTPMLARIHWTLLEAPASEPWITTDNPVALFEPFPVKAKNEIYGPSLQFLFPLSPRFLLFGEPMTKGPDDRGRVPAHTVRQMTDDFLRIAHQQVYASFFSKELQARVNEMFNKRDPLFIQMPANYRR
jgi:hypothetical protein